VATENKPAACIPKREGGPVSPDGRVSVVVITHNRRDELDRTLRLLGELPEPPPIVVVDNASTDGTATMVRSRHPDVTLLTPGRNLGAVGRNLGVQLVDTPYVAFCDDDTWYEPGALGRAADLLDGHPTLAVVTGSVTVEPEGTLDAICSEMAQSPLDPAPRSSGSAARRNCLPPTWPGRDDI
jgi:N-acetylglucosaminyl-diphospho-decaprenol L-rhamnosyltransferase